MTRRASIAPAASLSDPSVSLLAEVELSAFHTEGHAKSRGLKHLTKNPTRLSTEQGLSKGPATQRGLFGSDTRQVK